MLILCGYIEKLTVKPELGQFKIVVFGEALTSESVLQSRASWEDAAQVDLTSHLLNMKRMSMVRMR